jgi:putative ABC transport system permease protein
VPYAWLQLSHEKLRLVAAVGGITFAVILVFMQLGLREALFDSAVRLHQRMDYDLVMLSPRTTYLVQTRAFPRSRLYQVAGVEGVESVSPLYMHLASSYYEKTPGTHRKMLTIGIDPSDTNIAIDGVDERLAELRKPDRVIMDRYARSEFQPIVADFEHGDGVELQLNERHVELVGLYGLGTSFGVDASVVTSDLNFLRIFPDRRPGNIDLGLIRVRDDADVAAVAAAISQFLPRDVLLLTQAEYVQREVDYWNGATPIGYIFTLGAIIGVIVGVIIVYQILYSDVTTHLPEYATLKAIGYTNGFLSRLILQEATILSIMGFLPALGLTLLLYARAAAATQLPIAMTVERGALVFALTVIMCAVSGLLAVRKLKSLDPAEVFA